MCTCTTATYMYKTYLYKLLVQLFVIRLVNMVCVWPTTPATAQLVTLVLSAPKQVSALFLIVILL